MADTGHRFAHSPQPLHFAGSNAASKDEVATASNILNRLMAESMAQQQPQQWQTNAGRFWTLSATCTSPSSRVRAKMSSASSREIFLPRPWRATYSAEELSVVQTSFGFAHAFPSCSMTCRQ